MSHKEEIEFYTEFDETTDLDTKSSLIDLLIAIKELEVLIYVDSGSDKGVALNLAILGYLYEIESRIGSVI